MAIGVNIQGTDFDDILTYTNNGIFDAKKGDDIIAITDCDGITIYAGDGNDNVTIENSVVKQLSMQSGINTVNIRNSNVSSIAGGNGDNTISMVGGSVVLTSGNIGTVAGNTSTGNETVTVNGANITNAISLRAGDDVLTVNSGSIKSAFMGSGNDVVNVNGGLIESVYTNEGTNLIRITGGVVNNICGGIGVDSVVAAGGTARYVAGGLGNDIFTIDWSKVKNITINAGESGNMGADKLTIQNATRSAFTISYADSAKTQLKLADSSGNYILIHNWAANPMSAIAFSDKSLSASEINSLIGGLDTNVYGGHSTNGTAVTGKTVNLNAANTVTNVYGGCVEGAGSGSASNNTVTISGSTKVAESAFGGYVLDEVNDKAMGSAVNNSVTITGSAQVVDDVVGGKSANGTAANNTVTISGNAIIGAENRPGDIEGGHACWGTASGNVVTVTDYAKVYGDVAGGTSEDNTACLTEGNTVRVNGNAKVYGNVIGGTYIEGSVRDNVVTIEDNASVSGNVYSACNYMPSSNYYGKIGENTVTISGNASVGGTVYGAAGDDIITVSTSKATKVDGKAGEDFIVVNGGSGHTISGGSGIDDYSIDWSKAKNITIDNSTDDTRNRDFLSISGARSTDFSYSYNSTTDTLTLTNASNWIKILGWKSHGLGNIEFSDTELSLAQINAKVGLPVPASVNVSNNMSYDAGSGNVYVFNNDLLRNRDSAEVTLRNLSSDTVIDLFNLRLDTACIEFDTEGNSLYITVWPCNDDWDEIGEITIALDNYLANRNVHPTLKFSRFDNDEGIPVDEYVTLTVGSTGADTVNLDNYSNGNDGVMYFTNGGGDKVTGTKGDILVYGDSGVDKVYLTTTKDSLVYTNAGNDTVVVKNSSWCDVCTGDGNDTIVIDNIGEGGAFGDAGDDVILVSNVEGHVELAGNEGHDKYFVAINSVENADINLAEVDGDLNPSLDSDSLIICGSQMSKLMLGYSDGHSHQIVIDEYFGGDDWRGNISLGGSGDNPLSTVKVLDATAGKSYSIAFNTLKNALESSGGEICLANISGWTTTNLSSDSDQTLYTSLQAKLSGNI